MRFLYVGWKTLRFSTLRFCTGFLLALFAFSADYLLRYVDAYQAEGVPIFALTLQNEPHFEPKDYSVMRVEPAQRAAFIGGHLGPLMAKHHPRLRIMDWDHNWDEPGSPAAVRS